LDLRVPCLLIPNGFGELYGPPARILAVRSGLARERRPFERDVGEPGLGLRIGAADVGVIAGEPPLEQLEATASALPEMTIRSACSRVIPALTISGPRQSIGLRHG